MVFKSFRLNVFLRIFLILLTVLLLLYCISKTEWIITTTLVALLLIYQVYLLVEYVDKVNSDLTRFLLAIKHRDFSQVFVADGRGKSFNELRDAFNLIIKEFQKISAEKEIHHHYLQTIIEHIGIALISLDEEGNVELFNKAGKDLLRVPHLGNTNRLQQLNPQLHDSLRTISPGNKQLIKTNIKGESLQLSIHATALSIEGKKVKLVSIQNIKSELEEKEIEAWQKLIRVLTHEIMNSVTPISSLSSSTVKLLENETGGVNANISEENAEDIHLALTTIEKRSQGLLSFVEIYRNLTRIPQPHIKNIDIKEVIDNVYRLLQTDIINHKIKFNVIINYDGKISADAELVEQVLINLIINAIDAVRESEDPAISIAVKTSDTRKPIIEVSDNGEGISEDVIDKIFIPFFTTKKKGSGIGLSFSRQIMRLHGGSLSVKSEQGKGTTFFLRF